MSGPVSEAQFVRVINGARFELEASGNPAYAVVLLDAAGEAHLSPMVYATVAPAADHGQRILSGADPGEQVFVVSRSASGRRAIFTVVEPKTLRRLHQRLEVIEETFAETDGKI
jgi:hypothetical protein